MLKSHKYWLGLFWLVTIFVLPLPLIQALAQGLTGTINQSQLFGAQIGTIAYTWMLFAIVVAEKPRWIDRLIGLPEMYLAHGVIGLGAVVLAFVHSQLMPSDGLIALTGHTALYTFIGVAVYSIFFLSGWLTSRSALMRKLKRVLEKVFRYETSVWIHRLNVVATLFVFAHVILIPYIRVIMPFMIGFYTYSAFTALTYIYMHTGKRANHKVGRLVGNRQLADRVTELIIRLRGRGHFRPGDYTFISFPEIEGMRELHPFSLVSYNPKTRQLQFAIRNEADFTGRLAEVPLGAKVRVDGAYGRLINAVEEHDGAPLVFIGSGIGSVPLISLVLGLVSKRPITFVRVARDAQDLIYEGSLQEIARKNENLRYHSQVGRLSEAQVQALFSTSAFYLLGGSPQMMRGTERMLRDAGVAGDQIYGEKFSF